jgi:DNA primase
MNARDLRNSAPLDDPRALCDALGLGSEPRDRQRQAGGLTVRCPVHGGVSCSVTRGPDGTVRVRCFGCDFSGDAFDLVAAVRGYDVRRDFGAVVREAASLANCPIEVRPPRPEAAPRLSDGSYEAIASARLDLCSPLRSVAPDVARYLDARGVFADAEAIGVCGLPTDTRELVKTLLATFDRAELERAGVLRTGLDAIEWPRAPLLIPWRDRYGRITCIQRRRIDGGSPKYLSPPGRAPRAPFGMDLLAVALTQHGEDCEVAFVEGAIDTLARRRIARSCGENVAVLGVYSAASPCEGLPLDLLAGRSVLLALDDDAAGERACAKLAARLQGVARALVRERPTEAKDWADALVRGAA